MITYQSDTQGVTPDQLRGFFVGWPNPPSLETHLKLLDKSDMIELAVDDKTGDIVGFVTAISDLILAAYIPLLEVLPEHKGKGIGSELVKRILKRLDRLYMVVLSCDTDVQSFYSRLGMTEAVGMRILNFDRQSGK